MNMERIVVDKEYHKEMLQHTGSRKGYLEVCYTIIYIQTMFKKWLGGDYYED